MTALVRSASRFYASRSDNGSGTHDQDEEEEAEAVVGVLGRGRDSGGRRCRRSDARSSGSPGIHHRGSVVRDVFGP